MMNTQMSSEWLRVALLPSEISRSTTFYWFARCGMQNKQAIRFFSIKDKQPIIIIVRLEKGKKEPICQLNMALVSSRSLISTRTRKRS